MDTGLSELTRRGWEGKPLLARAGSVAPAMRPCVRTGEAKYTSGSLFSRQCSPPHLYSLPREGDVVEKTGH